MMYLQRLNGSIHTRNFLIRRATTADKTTIGKIWRLNTAELGGVQFAGLNKTIAAGTVNVAVLDGVIVGFIEYYARQDNWNTVYHVAVHPHYRRFGIGKQLIYSVPCPIRLKVTQDNTSAITFYESLHFIRTISEKTRGGTNLYVYELRVLFIQCAGNNRKFPAICHAVGIGYGSRHDDQIRGYPTMIDINWRSYDWNEYKTVIRQHHPIMAMVADYETPDKRNLMLKQVTQLKNLGVLRVMVCPKFDGAISHIPDGCIVAVSLQSSYAGFEPNIRELTGRRVHLLGGSPNRQKEWIKKVAGVGGVVVSVDGNTHTRANGKYQDQRGAWVKSELHTPYYALVETSANNIARALQHTATHKQLPLAI